MNKEHFFTVIKPGLYKEIEAAYNIKYFKFRFRVPNKRVK